MTNKESFTIFPAIHLRGGQVVRFTAGDVSNATVYSADPIACARNWIEQGAEWLQVINVDAAFDEDASHNWRLIKNICQLDARVQFGGGIRTLEDVDWAMKVGVDRVYIGTAAVENPRIIADAIVKYGAERVVLAIDTDDSGAIRTRGWRNKVDIESATFGRQMRRLGVQTAIYTNIQRDGSMSGVDWQSAATLAQFTGLQIIAGGGVSSYDDVLACYHQEGIVGVAIGRALYTNNVRLDKAIQSLRLKLSFDSGVPQWKENQRTPWAQLRYKLVQHNLKKHLPDGQALSILDAGGGNGRDAIPLATAGHNVTLLDASLPMLNDAGIFADELQVADRMDYRFAPVEEMGNWFEANQFDVILSHEVLSYVDDPETFLAALVAPLKPGGVVSLVGFNRYSLPYRSAFLDGSLADALLMIETRKRRSELFDTAEAYYTAEEVAVMFRKMGLEVEASYGIRCLYDYWGDNADKRNDKTARELEALEMALTELYPYKLLARYFQLIVRKPRSNEEDARQQQEVAGDDKEAKRAESPSRQRDNKQEVMTLDSMMQGDDLRGANLRQAVLCSADLSGKLFQESDLRWADLRGANCQQADFSHAHLLGAKLGNANCQAAMFTKATLSGAKLRDANLSLAGMQCTDLSFADLRGADLTHTDLTNAKLGWANFGRTDLSQATLRGARYNRQTVWPTGFSPHDAGCIPIAQWPG